MTRSPATARPDIDPSRMLHRLRTLAGVGRNPGGGITRPGFSPACDDAHAFVSESARDGGLHARTDPAGNLIITRRPGTADRLTLLLGSHLDTVVDGGWLDGAYGVIAALEVLHSLAAVPDLEWAVDLAVVAFANEEGALFPQPFWGSMALAGMYHMLPTHPRDYHGNALRPALARAGGDLAALPAATWPPQCLTGYLELHIEQGPMLEAAGVSIGVVDTIVGRTVLQADLAGTAAHAGTTPMGERRDALAAAAELTTFVEGLPAAGQCKTATVGRIDVSPNSANTIAGRVRCTIDLRDGDPRRLDRAEQVVRSEIATIADRRDIYARCDLLAGSRPATMDPDLRKQIAGSAEDLSLRYQNISSGAGHDAQIMATHTPTAMIFVPSIGGVSHVPGENTGDDDLAAGARVLLYTVHRLVTR
jgi:beta-ureidopropionase / N-carbamoyl-L-amino-acid hydrolase